MRQSEAWFLTRGLNATLVHSLSDIVDFSLSFFFFLLGWMVEILGTYLFVVVCLERWWQNLREIGILLIDILIHRFFRWLLFLLFLDYDFQIPPWYGMKNRKIVWRVQIKLQAEEKLFWKVSYKSWDISRLSVKRGVLISSCFSVADDCLKIVWAWKNHRNNTFWRNCY